MPEFGAPKRILRMNLALGSLTRLFILRPRDQTGLAVVAPGTTDAGPWPF
jgi:hypothetical protein